MAVAFVPCTLSDCEYARDSRCSGIHLHRCAFKAVTIALAMSSVSVIDDEMLTGMMLFVATVADGTLDE